MCGCGHRYGIRQIESLHVAIRNASAHKTHDQFTEVMLIHGFFPQVSSFEVDPNVIGPTSTTCERFVHYPAVVDIMCCVFPSIIYNK